MSPPNLSCVKFAFLSLKQVKSVESTQEKLFLAMEEQNRVMQEQNRGMHETMEALLSEVSNNRDE